MSTQIEPLGARVLIRPVEQENTTASGIILPETAKEKPQQGIVEAVGDEEEMLTDMAVGDKVLFPKYTGTEIKIDSVAYLLMDEGDVLARLRES
jgi:chaperonin GroES